MQPFLFCFTEHRAKKTAWNILEIMSSHSLSSRAAQTSLFTKLSALSATHVAEYITAEQMVVRRQMVFSQ